MDKKKLIYGTFILSVVNFISRILGFFYKITIVKYIGAQGVGLFQMVSPILTVALTITGTGIPIAISKLVSTNSSLGNNQNIKKILRAAFFINIVLSIFLSLIIFIFGKTISYDILKNNNIYLSILFLIPSIIIVSLSCILKGYFYGIKKVSPCGISQIIQQLSKIGFVLYIISKLSPVSPKVGVFICVVGISVGDFLEFLWLLISSKFISKKSKLKSNLRYSSIFSDIIKISFPITLSRILNVTLQLLNSILIPKKLVLLGYSYKEATVIFGRAIGMTLPLIFLPFMIISPLVSNMIPSISELIALKNYKDVNENISICLRIAFIVTIPTTIFFTFWGEPIGLFLYNDSEVGKYLSVIGYSTVFLCLQHILSGVLQAIGKEGVATINNFIGNVFQLTSAYLLLSKPSLGIYGFFLSFVLSTLITTILNSIIVYKSTGLKISISSYIFKPLISTLVSLLITTSAYSYISFMPCVFLGVTVYILTLFLIKGLPKSTFRLIFK